jgi:hypothetical protein
MLPSIVGLHNGAEKQVYSRFARPQGAYLHESGFLCRAFFQFTDGDKSIRQTKHSLG